MFKMKKHIAIGLSIAMAIGSVVSVQTDSEAKKKAVISTKKITMKLGQKKVVKVKNVKKVKWSVSGKAVKLQSKKATKVTVVAKKVGSATVKAKAGKKVLKCKVTVNKSFAPNPTNAPASSEPTNAPATNTPAPTSVPTEAPTQEPTATPQLSENSLKAAFYGKIDNIGTCVSYTGYGKKAKQLQTQEIIEHLKDSYNSVTLENEMKPSELYSQWGGEAISVEEAKERGYVIPDSYKEAVVPSLNFDNVDNTVKFCKDNNMRMRAHVLMWHQQTNTKFFKENYSDSGKLVTPEVMDARLEMYVRTVMEHVLKLEKELTGKAGSLVYAWDVTNEYVHRTNVPTNPSWMDVYGDMGLEPSYVKAAFTFANDELVKNGCEDTVKLYYNDYDTYLKDEFGDGEATADKIVKLVNFVNKDKKICTGIGMQSHISADTSNEDYFEAFDKFAATGLEISITELDLQGASATEDATSKKYGDIVKGLLDRKKAGANIAGITWWGIHGGVSWITEGGKGKFPLLYKKLGTPNKNLEAVLAAARAEA